MSAAAVARPRLLRRPVSAAQREAARRNGAKSCGPRTPAGKAHCGAHTLVCGRCGAHTLVCGAKLHLFTPAEAEALDDETQSLIEAFRPAGPDALALVYQVALATFQMRRINQIEVDFQARNPRAILAIARLIGALGAIENRFCLLRLRCLRRLDRLATKNEANEPGNLLKQNMQPASAGVSIHPFFPSPSSPKASARRAKAGPPRSRVPGTLGF